MKYKMMVDESFTDKLDERFTYQPGDLIETKVDEKRKEDLVAKKLAHVVEEITEKVEPKTKGKEKGKKEEIVEPITEKEPTTEEITEEVEPTGEDE